MLITVEGARFVAQSKFEEREVPKKAGFRWNADRKRWETDQPSVAALLAEFADDAAKSRLDAFLAGGGVVAAVDDGRPKLLQAGSAWVFKSGFEFKDIPRDAGFTWNPAAKQWETTDPIRANRLVGYAEPEVARGLEKALAEVWARVEKSRAVGADVPIPAPDGREYLPYQRAGIAYAVEHDGVLIADEMGLGKTVQALGTMNVDLAALDEGEPYRALVICPASLKLNWQREAERWLVRKLPVHIIEGGKASPAWAKIAAEGGLAIINYDIVSKHRRGIDAVEWDTLVMDEAHLLKNPKAQRTKAVLGEEARP